MRVSVFQICLAGIMSIASISAVAGSAINQVPSCYTAGKLDIKPKAAQRSFYIVLDETVVLDDSLKRSLWDLVRPQIAAGTEFAIYRFSAYSQGRYLDIVTSGALEVSIDPKLRDSVSVPKLTSFDACLKGQAEYGLTITRNAIGQVLRDSSFELAKSDIEGSLFALAKVVKESKSPTRTVLLVSDMLENSAISSFYQNNGVRKIDPAAELRKTEAEKMFGDFGGASVYVMGAGLISPDGKAKAAAKPPFQYRDTKTMAALQDFWTQYFVRSHAKLEEFGAPALLSAIK
ncbi:MAG TPA: hypothetical protein VGP06_18050 [Janthinobacterium sp.]|jgi:hypothetical protein|nr:hypothetical protein [Janthinobacterium sp.]